MILWLLQLDNTVAVTVDDTVAVTVADTVAVNSWMILWLLTVG